MHFRTHRLMIFRILCLLAMALAGSTALAGEDFPFFCRPRHGIHAFSVKSDGRSSTGFSLTLFRRGRQTAILPVDLGRSDDGRYWTVYAAQSRLVGLAKLEVFAFISQEDGASSHAAVRLTSALTNPEWDLAPFDCQ